MPPSFTQALSKMDELLLGIIILTDQKIVYHNKLIFSELFAMILPVVLVRPLELIETFLDRDWGWLRVIEVSRQLHEEIGQEGHRMGKLPQLHKAQVFRCGELYCQHCLMFRMIVLNVMPHFLFRTSVQSWSFGA